MLDDQYHPYILCDYPQVLCVIMLLSIYVYLSHMICSPASREQISTTNHYITKWKALKCKPSAQLHVHVSSYACLPASNSCMHWHTSFVSTCVLKMADCTYGHTTEGVLNLCNRAVSEKTPHIFWPLLPIECVTSISGRTDAQEVRCDFFIQAISQYSIHQEHKISEATRKRRSAIPGNRNCAHTVHQWHTHANWKWYLLPGIEKQTGVNVLEGAILWLEGKSIDHCASCSQPVLQLLVHGH